MHVTSPVRTPLVTGGKTYADVTEDICKQVEGKPTKEWKAAFTLSFVVLLYGTCCVFWTWWEGLGVWGLNKTVGWAWDITNFVWWVGIGHAGTLISAILLLFRQKWRTSINRAAEAMTIFAVICAASFIVMHMGRPWCIRCRRRPMGRIHGGVHIRWWQCVGMVIRIGVIVIPIHHHHHHR